MKQKTTRFIIVMLLIAASQLSFAQYFQGLYDIDSTQDWGWNIFLQPDGNYFVEGGSLDPLNSEWYLTTMQMAADGSAMLNKNIVQINNASLYGGNPGESKMLSGGGYLSPVSVSMSPYRCAAGIIKYNPVGDTIFVKTYTDTSLYFDCMICCAIMPDDGYIVGGFHELNVAYYYPGYIIRTDSMGDTLWTHTYQKIDTQWVTINNVIPLPDGRIVAEASSTRQVILPSGLWYYHNTPWFMVLDSIGNLIKDTLYTTTYMDGGNNCGSLYKDNNGGYVNIGNYDQVYGGYPSDIHSFPSYIAHLDTNFRITWITPLDFSTAYGHRQSVTMRQLQDSSYMIYGDALTNYDPGTFGWAAKISRTGAIIWDNVYSSDSIHLAYFTDMVETPGGNLVFTGCSMNDTLPAWHTNEDVWIVGVDSNGCENPFCAPTAVKTLPPVSYEAVKIYPNPTNGNFTINCPQPGALIAYNIQGQQIATYQVKPGTTSLQVPATISAGVYVCKYIPTGGNKPPTIVRLIYQQ